MRTAGEDYLAAQGRVLRTKRKTIALEISREAELLIRAPLATPLSTINQLVADKKPWIERKIAEIKARGSNQLPKVIAAGEVFPYLGRTVKLSVVDNDEINLQPGGDLQLGRILVPFAKRRIIKWYREEAKKYFFPRVRYLSEEHNLRYTELALSGAEKRWGSCSAKNAIRLNWRLIMAPVEVSDYVIVHELTHIRVKGHSKLFWESIAAIMPDYRKQATWLKENANKLYFKFASGQIPKIKVRKQ